MAELTPLEKLQPCLLDRLTDDEPKKEQESRNKRVMSLQKYRQAVMRDLSWLLNAHADAEQSGLYEFEEIPSSVLNFGVQNVAGMTSSNIRVEEMRYQLIEMPRRFEPRIIPSTISINMVKDSSDISQFRSIRFEIQGDLWAQPIPETLFIKTEMDLESGKCLLNWGISG